MKPRAILCDIDGTLYIGDQPIPGAIEAVERMRSGVEVVRFLTNTTRMSRRSVQAMLQRMGLSIPEAEIITAPVAAAERLRELGLSRVLALLQRDTLEDLAGLQLADEGEADAVLVGDMGRAWTFNRMNAGFRAILGGARLFACQKNRYWREADGLSLDAGAFVAALEYAASTEAEVIGKPSPAFFLAALAGTGIAPAEALVIGDDLESDVAGALASGMSAVLVRTGKYRAGDELRLQHAGGYAAIDSVASLTLR